MDLAESIIKFKQTVERYFPQAQFAAYSLDQLRPIREALALSPDLMEWYQVAAPLDFHVMGLGSSLYLANPLNLTRKQGSYRWEWEHPEKLDTEWNPHWVVIADIGDDPIIAHVDQPGTPISFAFHGMGTWTPYKVAPDLAKYLELVCQWLDLCVGKYDGTWNMLDDDCVLLPKAEQDITTMLATVLDNTDFQANAFQMIWN